MAAVDTKVGLDDFLKNHGRDAFEALPELPALPVTIPTAEEMEPPNWLLYDAADAWAFAPVCFTVDSLLPALGVVWWGGMPKRFKSLFMLYVCLAIASGRETVADHFSIRKRPRILYVAREDGGPRIR